MAVEPERAAEALFAAPGELPLLMRDVDWTRTPIGPVERWPQSLRTSVSICLSSRFPILLWWGPELVMLYNDAYRPILGALKHPAALGQPGRECWPEIWEVIGPMLRQVMDQGTATWSEDQLLLLERNGYPEECYFTFSYSPIHDESGGIGGVFTAVTETTGRVIGERRLETLRALAARAGTAGNAREACSAAAEALASNGADLPFALLYLIEPDGRHARLAGATGIDAGTVASPPTIDLDANGGGSWPLRAARGGEPLQVEDIGASVGPLLAAADAIIPRQALILPLALAGQDGETGFLVAGLNPRRALDGDYRSFLSLVAGQIATALADARAHEAERSRIEALAALDQAKTIFFSDVSHEFRTPLTLMLGPLADALADRVQPLPPRQRERLVIAERSGLRLLRLVNTLLDFARIEAGRVEAVYEPLDLAALTADLASAFRSAMEAAGLRFVVDCPPLAAPVWVDREMWEKIVLNLLSNAFKFTLAGEVTVSLRGSDGGVELLVSDTGSGIPPAELPRVFERFHRVRGAHARTQEGTGIGLALVADLARLHGGAVTARSKEGRGSTFSVTLPWGNAHLPAERLGSARTLGSTALGAASFVQEALRWLPADKARHASLGDPPAAAQSAHRGATPDLHPERSPEILIADDNADMRDYLQGILGDRYRVRAVADGHTALQAVERRLPDLVLSDVMMPGLDGLGLLAALRADPRTAAIPVILLSARAGEEAAVAGLRAGADDYLVKPFAARELLARVGAHLALARVRQETIDRLGGLAEVAIAVNSAHAVDEILVIATERARLLIGAHEAMACLATGDQLQPLTTISLSEAYRGRDVEDLTTDRLGLAAQVCAENRPLRLSDEALHVRSAERGEAVGAMPPGGWLAAPLIGRDGRNAGLIQIAAKMDGEFSAQDEATLVQLAHLAAVAIENAHLYAAALEANQRMDEFLGIAAHELRTPLTSILGNVQLTRRRVQSALGAASRLTQQDGGAPSENVARLRALEDLLARAERQVGVLNRLVGDLLDVSRIQAGKLEFRLGECDLLTVVGDAVEEQRLAHPDRQISLDLPAVSSCSVFGDAERLGQVVTNYLTNALKYSAADQPVAVRLACDEQGVLVTVRDRGPGIPSGELPEIWERFHRVPGVEVQSGSGVGLGLGLHICRTIIERHGGEVGVESTPGEGSTFWFRLPVDC